VSHIRVALADDHGVLRDAVADMLRRRDLEVVAQVATGTELVEACRQHQPDVAVVDLSMPFDEERPEGGGLAAMKELRAVSPATRILVLTMHDSQAHVRAALAAGAAGYLVKREVGRDLEGAIRDVHAGRSYLRVSLDEGGLQDVIRKPTPATAFTACESLSPRELEVLELVARGYTNKEIASQLGITAKSVSTYRSRVRDKLGVKTRASVVRFALRAGLLASEDSPAAKSS
jgi:DNA-binding NarL/FixJ family response regulator